MGFGYTHDTVEKFVYAPEFRNRMNFITISFKVQMTVNDFRSGFVMFMRRVIYTMKVDGISEEKEKILTVEKSHIIFNDTFLLLLFERIFGPEPRHFRWHFTPVK